MLLAVGVMAFLYSHSMILHFARVPHVCSVLCISVGSKNDGREKGVLCVCVIQHCLPVVSILPELLLLLYPCANCEPLPKPTDPLPVPVPLLSCHFGCKSPWLTTPLCASSAITSICILVFQHMLLFQSSLRAHIHVKQNENP